jgi:hypothetical protein
MKRFTDALRSRGSNRNMNEWMNEWNNEEPSRHNRLQNDLMQTDESGQESPDKTLLLRNR